VDRDAGDVVDVDDLDLTGVDLSRIEMPSGWMFPTMSLAHLRARPGVVNMLRKPSPRVFTSRPRCASMAVRTTWLCSARSSVHAASPIATAWRVESTMSVNSRLATVRDDRRRDGSPQTNAPTAAAMAPESPSHGR
jgi:hypothetical protein